MDRELEKGKKKCIINPSIIRICIYDPNQTTEHIVRHRLLNKNACDQCAIVNIFLPEFSNKVM